ncbi:MAG TPA: hypothetical protein VGB50_10435 [Flavobacterium sp.]|jgi:uncharacterized membrane protein YcaP (DUF421 family)
MDKHDIEIDDWQRILFGQGDPLYLAEVAVRMIVMYLFILIAVRLMGKRMSSELDRADLVARVSLAAAVGLPIQSPDRGLLVAGVVVVVIVLVGRILARLVVNSLKFEQAFQGVNSTLVGDGTLHLAEMRKIHVTRKRIMPHCAKKASGISER